MMPIMEIVHMKNTYVYILADASRHICGTRISEDGFLENFEAILSGRYQLVWFESHETLKSAQVRQAALQNWDTHWQHQLIEQFNPLWQDLSMRLLREHKIM